MGTVPQPLMVIDGINNIAITRSYQVDWGSQTRDLAIFVINFNMLKRMIAPVPLRLYPADTLTYSIVSIKVIAEDALKG